MAKEITEENVREVLADVKEPALGKSLADAGLIREVSVKDSNVEVSYGLISPGHPGQSDIEAEIKTKLMELDGVKDIKFHPVIEVPVDGRIKDVGLTTIKNVIAVASGKGGVGKSTVSVNIAV